MFGNGSDGALIVNSGTRNLSLNRKYQFTSVYVAVGAILSTNSTTGAVLYITAQESITIDGNIDVSNKVNRGDNSWAVTIDGVTYESPGVANGARWSGQAVNSNGYGSGGAGLGNAGGATGGGSSTGGASPSGGATRTTGNRTSNGTTTNHGLAGSQSGGGSGGAHNTVFGMDYYYGGSVWATGGAGASSHGGNGANGASSIAIQGASNNPSAAGASASGGGGGGGGGFAGRAGVKVILKAPTITVNGKIITRGTNGGNGGNGGRMSHNGAWTNYWGNPGLGGGGGRGGRIELYYADSYAFDPVNISQEGGSGGYAGYGGEGNQQYTSRGSTGGHEGWSYNRVAPVADFTAETTDAFRGVPVQFTNTTQGQDSTWLWDFGDGTTSTAKNPEKTYTVNGTYTVKLTATNSAGSTTETKADYITVTTKKYTLDLAGLVSGGGEGAPFSEWASVDLYGSAIGGGQASFFTVYRALAQKDYEYRVFDEDWSYISTWANEVTSEFGYEQRLNENASELMVSLGRNPENRKVVYESLMDTTGTIITDNRGDAIVLHTETPNAVGPGTDVRENLNVEVYAFYGGYEALLDHLSDPILDTDGENILTQFGAPNGRRVYSGYISEYELAYGEQTGVEVTLVPHTTELSHYIFKDGDKTSVKYLNTDPVQMARDAMDNYIDQGGYIQYSELSMPLSDQETDYEFKLQTTRETIDKATDLMPSGWYNFPHPGENLVYMREKSPVPDHVFYLRKHLTDLKLRRSISGLVNEVYFTGGEFNPDSQPGVDLLKYYKDQESIDTYRRGLQRFSDSRVTLESTAQILSEAHIESYKSPRYRTTVTITDVVYDIENILLGDVVGFKNFGTFADSLALQIVAIRRHKHSVVLELDTMLTTQAKRLDTLRRQIEQEQIRNIPVQPV